MRVKKLILVNPTFGGPVSGFFGRIIKSGYPPIFAILEALTPKDYEIVAYHQPFTVKYEQGLVAITSFTSNVNRAYAYADRFRRAGATVVMGGCHVMFRVEEALEHCDSVVTGEVEGLWSTVLKDYEEGRLRKTYHGDAGADFWKHYHKGFLGLHPKKLRCAIQTIRGCKYKCKFCVIPNLYEGPLREVPVEKVVEQVKAVKGFWKHTIIFNDNNIFSNPGYAKRLFKALIPLGIHWQGLSSIDIAADEEALDLARDSGCRDLLIGFETINPRVVESEGGKFRMYGDYHRLIDRIKSRGIGIRGSFIIGFDEDSYGSLWRLFLFTLTAKIDFSMFSALTPFPGTPLFETYEREGRISSFDWDKFNCFNVVIKPKNLSPWALSLILPLLRYSFFFTTKTGWGIVFFVVLVVCLAAWLVF